MSLNSAQAEAVNTLAGPMLVLAGAGTGKTRVVTHRIARLIKSGIAPDRILAVTFTNKAAAEMQERAAALYGKRSKVKPWISTFHSLCLQILKRHICRLGYPARFTIYDRGDQESAARATLREIKAETTIRPGDLLAQISSWKSASMRPPQAERAAASDKEHLAAMAYRRYQQNLRNSAAVDFDDLLLLTEELFTNHADILQAEATRFDHVLVDEYQDTNAVQYHVIRALAAGHRNLCVVGDDDQSIYSWRGAEVQHILRFQHDWPDAKVIRLEENYRCTGPILAMANELIRFNSLRHEKSLRTVRDGERPRILQFADAETEARSVVEEIDAKLQTKQASPRDFAILFRTNELTSQFETELRKKNVPYVIIGGQSFFDRKEVRDVLAYLKTVVQPRDDVSLLRIINTPPRGIGRTTITRFVDRASASGKPVWEVLKESGTTTPGIAVFRELINSLRAAQERPDVSNLITHLLTEIKYEKEIEREFPDANERNVRWNMVQQVVNVAASYEKTAKKPTLADFLSEVTLDGRQDNNEKEKGLARNAVVLMTLHGAKGLEFPQVYLVGMEQGILPHQKSLEEDDVEEERRLCYVGITRAQDRLTMTFPLTRMKWGKPRPTIPSQFLFEMTGQADRVPQQKTASSLAPPKSRKPIGKTPHKPGKPTPRKKTSR